MKWIKFSERWPDTSRFLVYTSYEGIITAETFYDSKTEVMCACGDYLVHLKIDEDYWMPLPDKPEVDNG